MYTLRCVGRVDDCEIWSNYLKPCYFQSGNTTLNSKSQNSLLIQK
jgi:hypothetical protein